MAAAQMHLTRTFISSYSRISATAFSINLFSGERSRRWILCDYGVSPGPESSRRRKYKRIPIRYSWLSDGVTIRGAGQSVSHIRASHNYVLNSTFPFSATNSQISWQSSVLKIDFFGIHRMHRGVILLS